MKNHIVARINPYYKDEAPNHTVYENLDKELKAKIQSFVFDRTKVVIGLPREEWNIVEWEEEEVRCERGRNIHYYKREEVERHLEEDFQKALNQEFPAYKYFKSVFGVLSLYREEVYNGTAYYSLCRIDLNNLFFPDRPVVVDTTGVQNYNNIASYNLRVYENGLELETQNHGQNLSLYFNKDGDFVNRDHNIDLSLYERKDINPMDLYQKTCDTILGIKGSFQKTKDKYFSESVCYTISTRDDSFRHNITLNGFKTEYDSNSFRVRDGRKSKIVKRPTKFETKTSEDLLEDFVSKIPEKMMQEFKLKMAIEIV